MRLNVMDNRDPRWSDEDNEAIASKVEEAMALSPRLEILPVGGKVGGVLTDDERRWMLTASFREIVKATSLDNLVCAPAAMLEQFAVLAGVRNHNIKGELVQLIRVFMMAYAEPSTNLEASRCLDEMERVARKALAAQSNPDRFKWKALPGSTAPATSNVH
jgi:hypothetical protein